MLSIRLFRAGKKNQPFFKIVVTDKKNPPRGGRFVEELGFLNPLTKERKIKGDRVKYWLSVGAKPSDTVYNLIIKEEIIKGKKRPSHKEKPAEKESADKTRAEEPKQDSKAQNESAKAETEEKKPEESGIKEKQDKKEEVIGKGPEANSIPEDKEKKEIQAQDKDGESRENEKNKEKTENTEKEEEKR